VSGTFNVHRDGVAECVQNAYRKLRNGHRHEISIDCFGDVRVRRTDLNYKSPVPDNDVLGVYGLSATVDQLQEDIGWYAARLRPIYRRKAAYIPTNGNVS
jgi:hypothetical protein